MGDTSGNKKGKIETGREKRICMGILAHVDAGKTTLSEGILYLTGSLRKLGRVDHGDAFLDNFALERSRGITIFSKQAVFPLGETEVTLIDTPGHVDFSAEMERALWVMDYAVLVISGADGIQGHTETLWRLLRAYKIPTFLFINKMDQDGTDRDALLAELKKNLDDGVLLLTACGCRRKQEQKTWKLKQRTPATKRWSAPARKIFWKRSPCAMRMCWRSTWKPETSGGAM